MVRSFGYSLAVTPFIMGIIIAIIMTIMIIGIMALNIPDVGVCRLRGVIGAWAAYLHGAVLPGRYRTGYLLCFEHAYLLINLCLKLPLSPMSFLGRGSIYRRRDGDKPVKGGTLEDDARR